MEKPRNRMPNDEETKKWQKIPFRIVYVSSILIQHIIYKY